MDKFDRAQSLEQLEREQAIARQIADFNFHKPSLTHCIDCAVEIPKTRQQLGGVTRCVDCQDLHERYFQ